MASTEDSNVEPRRVEVKKGDEGGDAGSRAPRVNPDTVGNTDSENPYGAGLDGHPEPVPNPVTGQTLTVMADPADNQNDDRPLIQAAIDSAGFGDEVFLPNGIYNILSTTDGEGSIRLESGVNLRGESEQGVVLAVSGDGEADGVLTAYAKDSRVEDVVLSKMTLLHATDTFKYGVRLSKNTSYGTGVVRRIVVDRVTVKNAHRRAFRVYCASDIVIQNSTARDLESPTSGYGFEAMCEPSEDPEVSAQWIVFRNNQALGPNMRHGFIIQDEVHHSLIEGCYTSKNHFGAIELHARGEHHIEIRNNLIEDSLGAGIKIRSGSGGQNWVHDNVIRGAHWGILVEGNGNTIERNELVEFDSLESNLFGIRLNAVSDVHVLNNVVRNNLVMHEDYDFFGVYVAGATSGRIHDNLIMGNQKGLYIGPEAQGVDLMGNRVSDNLEFDIQDERTDNSN